MLLPRCHIFIMTTNVDMLYGRCYCQVADGMATLIIMLADVIAKWQMEWPLQGWSDFSLSSEVLNRTSSHM